MYQITLLDRTGRVIEAYFISEILYQKLLSVATASSIELFTPDLIQELSFKFLRALIDQFNLHSPLKNDFWHLNKAHFYALNFYPWYLEFLALSDRLNQFSLLIPQLTIELTGC